MFVLTGDQFADVRKAAGGSSTFANLRDMVIAKPQVSEIPCDCGAVPIIGPIFQPTGPLDNG